jgi:hypothetical protein
MNRSAIVSILGLGILVGSVGALAQEQRPMGFFVTSVGMGNGADLGGLEGADGHCQKLATAAGAGKRIWRAYLSTEEPDKRGIFARSRIGNGPWYNARGVLIAANLTDLHLHNKTITLETALDENGNRIKAHPLVPDYIPVHGYIYECKTAGLVEVPEATAAGKAS